MQTDVLKTTQRLPLIGKNGGRKYICKGCSNTLELPLSLTPGHIRCRFCKKIHRIGIPSQYLRIECDCGKILTALKTQIGRTGKCPGCGKKWELKPLEQNASGKKTPVTYATSKWHLQTPYPEQNLFEILNIDAQAKIIEIKKACRNIQKKQKRNSHIFQQAQLSRDILCKPQLRLRYEFFLPHLQLWWSNYSKQKWLKLHDKAIIVHQQAIDYEQQKIYHKADKMWRKAIKLWLALDRCSPFWAAVNKRGQDLFADKFKNTICDEIRQAIFSELLISVSCQMRDRYLAEHNIYRAQRLFHHLLPVLYHCLQKTGDENSKQALLAYYIEEIKYMIGQACWKKAHQLLVALHTSFANDKIANKFIAEIFPLLSPFLNRKQRKNAAQFGLSGENMNV